MDLKNFQGGSRERYYHLCRYKIINFLIFSRKFLNLNSLLFDIFFTSVFTANVYNFQLNVVAFFFFFFFWVVVVGGGLKEAFGFYGGRDQRSRFKPILSFIDLYSIFFWYTLLASFTHKCLYIYVFMFNFVF